MYWTSGDGVDVGIGITTFASDSLLYTFLELLDDERLFMNTNELSSFFLNLPLECLNSHTGRSFSTADVLWLGSDTL